jgi:uncharacterized Zn finger protein
MQELIFHVQGSEDEPYEIRIVRQDEGKLSAYCTCQAGTNGMHCKHRIGILTGKPENLIEPKKNKESLLTVAGWFRGSDIEAVLTQLTAAEEEYEAIKSKISRLKKSLAKAMLD